MTALPRATPLVLALASAAALAALADPPAPPAPSPPERGAQAFVDVVRVLQSPRCVNCHPNGDAPTVGDDAHTHPMEIRRGLEKVGMACDTCHRSTPSPQSRVPGAPPAAPGWGLPPAEHPMVFAGKTAPDLCAQLKDPAQNGGREGAALLHHVGADALVLYGWDPGGGRSVPPLSHDAFVARFGAWVSAGMPCP